MARNRTGAAVRITSSEDGLHLEDSILWFDSRFQGELSFLSSATFPYSTEVPQVLATEETVRILEACGRKPNALVCQYNRPFAIGRLSMELLPTGTVLGGASLFVQSGRSRILYAPMLQPNAASIARKMQLRRASTLITSALHPDPEATFPSRAREIERVVASVHAHLDRGVTPLIMCHPIGIAQEVTKALASTGVPLTVHPQIYRVNRVYDSYGAGLGAYSLFTPRVRKRRVVIVPLGTGGARRRALHWNRTNQPVLLLDATMTSIDERSVFESTVETYRVASTCDGPSLRDVVAQVEPKEIFFFGPYAKRYAELFASSAPTVVEVTPRQQPALF